MLKWIFIMLSLIVVYSVQPYSLIPIGMLVAVVVYTSKERKKKIVQQNRISNYFFGYFNQTSSGNSVLLDSIEQAALIAIGVLVAAIFYSSICLGHPDPIPTPGFEVCDENWLIQNINGIQSSLNEELYGQHLVSKTIAEAVEFHTKDKNPQKPLVMSFHGSTGVGKTFVSNIIAKHLFKKGFNSTFVHKKISTLHYRHKENLKAYQADLKALIESSTKNCERSLFIFDEVDKMPEGLADVLKPYLGYHPSTEGTDYRKNIFIFLSNAAGDKINDFAVKHLAEGKRREDINSYEMEKIFAAEFKNPGDLKKAESILSDFVDFYVPFLPLERKHVKQCAAAEFKRLQILYDDRILENVASEIFYFPSVDQLFSLAGCKTVANKAKIFA